MDDDERELHRRVSALEADVRSQRTALIELKAMAVEARRTSQIAIERMEDSMRSDVAEAARVNVRFDRQDTELTRQTKMISDLAESDRRRTQRSLAMSAVKQEDERRKSLREHKLDRLLKLWPVALVIAPFIAAFCFWLLRILLARVMPGTPLP